MADLDITLVDSSYELVGKLASSGQADVYQARARAEAPEDQDFDFIFKVYKDSPKANQAMKNERAVLQRLEDRQVKGVPIPIGLQEYGAKTGSGAKGSGLLAKFLKGKDLAKLLEAKGANSGFDPGQVADWVKKLCEILGRIHLQGIVHGDLKPGNVLWNKEHNVIWLIDFGSAVFAGSAAQRSFTLTRPYASPQLLAGGTSKVTDDVYALGVTVFELLAGKQEYPVPLDWSLESNVLAARLKAGLAKLEVAAEFENRGLFEDGDADLLPRFAALVQKCLHPDPKERFQALDKVADVLKLPSITVTVGMTRQEPPVVPPPPSKWLSWPRVAWAAGAAVVLGTAVAGTLTMIHLKSSGRDSSSHILVSKPTNVVAHVARTPDAHPKPDVSPASPGTAATKPPPGHPPVELSVAPAPAAPLAPQPASGPVVSSPSPPPLAKFDGAAGRFTNSLGMVFVPVQTQSGKVWFCAWQTRVSDFKEFQAKTGTHINPTLKEALGDQLDLPIRAVTWEQAEAFCTWLTTNDLKAGLLPLAGSHYRLPRDLEWSAAAGLGPETGQTPKERMNGLELKLDTMTLNNKFHPVSVLDGGTNARGLYQMADNVAEWCEESYDADEQTKAFRTSRVVGEDDQKARYRGGRKMFNAEEWLGFRCVLEPGFPSEPMVAGGGSSPEQKMSKTN